MSKSFKALLLTGCLAGFLINGGVCVRFGRDCHAEVWTQTTWEGGPGQELWSDTTMYYTDIGMDWETSPGDLMLRYPGWENTGELAGAAHVHALIQASDGALYAGTWWNGDVFKSTDAGTTWVTTGELHPDVDGVNALLEGSGGAVYAAVPGFSGHNATVFKTTDGGATWFEPGNIPDDPYNLYTLIEAQDGSIYASGNQYAQPPQGSGAVFKTSDGGANWARTGDLDSTIHVWTVFQAANGTLYAGADYVRPFWSTDGGTTWQFTGRGGWVYEFAQDSQAALYAGVVDTMGGWVVKSADAGTSWVKMAEFPGALGVQSMLHAFDGTVYAGTAGDFSPPPQGAVFRSTDAGTTWVRTGDLEEAYIVWDLLQTGDGAIYAATGGYDGRVFRWGPPSGDLVSSIYDAGPNLEYGTMTWDETLNGQTLVMKVRTDTLSDMSTAPDWPSCPPAVNGDDISSLSSVEDGDPYIQYRVEMVSSRLDSTPVLHEVRIEYSPTGVEELKFQIPMAESQLFQNYPNPFTTSTRITYYLPPRQGDAETGAGGEESQISHRTSHITLTVYDLSGRLVRTLIDQLFNHPTMQQFNHVSWHGKDDRGARLPSGVYFYRLEAGEFTATNKMVVLR